MYGEYGAIVVDPLMGNFCAIRNTGTSTFDTPHKIETLEQLASYQPDVLMLASIRSVTIRMDEHSREEKRTVGGEDVSYDPPRFRTTVNFVVEIEVGNHSYVRHIRVRLNKNEIVIRHEGERLTNAELKRRGETPIEWPLDLPFAQWDATNAASQIKAASPATRIVAATSMPEVSFVERAHAAGIESFWYKEYAECGLIEVLDATMAGRSVYPSALPSARLGNALSSELTSQELAVLREMTTGASNAQIADRMCLSVHTVRTHVKHLLAKTGYETRTQLAVNASLAGLVVAHGS